MTWEEYFAREDFTNNREHYMLKSLQTVVFTQKLNNRRGFNSVVLNNAVAITFHPGEIKILHQHLSAN